MAKVYVITCGEYSDYHICTVTLDKDKAEILRKVFSNSYDEAEIEEYDTDEYEPIDVPCWKVTLSPRTVKVEKIRALVSNDCAVSYSGKTKKYFVYVRAEDEEHAMKIGIDRIMKCKAEKEKL